MVQRAAPIIGNQSVMGASLAWSSTTLAQRPQRGRVTSPPRLSGVQTREILSPGVPELVPTAPRWIREPFHRDGWVYEEKVDGWRMLAYKDGARVRLVGRNGRDHIRRFHDIGAAISKLSARTLVLDGCCWQTMSRPLSEGLVFLPVTLRQSMFTSPSSSRRSTTKFSNWVGLRRSK
jgi:ATP-dependent DNA ligase